MLRAMTYPSEIVQIRRDWLALLSHELYQTEQSACDHPIVEAKRLGDVPPAAALRAVAEHAAAALPELKPLLSREDRPTPGLGRTIGAAFSFVRDHAADLLLSSEKSYRGTLIGMRHGVDLVELVLDVAEAQGEPELADWCRRWLDNRRPLVEAAARELAWFAANPEAATAAAKRENPLARGLHAVFAGCQRAIRRLRSSALHEPAPTAAP
jgi:hypothetical protein